MRHKTHSWNKSKHWGRAFRSQRNSWILILIGLWFSISRWLSWSSLSIAHLFTALESPGKFSFYVLRSTLLHYFVSFFSKQDFFFFDFFCWLLDLFFSKLTDTSWRCSAMLLLSQEINPRNETALRWSSSFSSLFKRPSWRLTLLVEKRALVRHSLLSLRSEISCAGIQSIRVL